MSRDSASTVLEVRIMHVFQVNVTRVPYCLSHHYGDSKKFNCRKCRNSRLLSVTEVHTAILSQGAYSIYRMYAVRKLHALRETINDVSSLWWEARCGGHREVG